ncbi:GNAT family N-acetyltransferase [Herbaspirillum sp. DW155]|uniref:GNAT family N-acetyltransferase n=1 Tax=Herbaspirillum sp. DW155 TaxID=3095609 RepID=UPI003091F457|nr:GNAT family N-acetyltransferase [Herbaspirillum sp. DW155]
MTHYQWRPMRADDLSRVMHIAAQVHEAYFEAQEVFAERLALFPQGCRIAMASEAPEDVIGYAFMHPARYGHAPALNTLLGGLDGADCLHLHDVALLPQARGSGLGRALVEELLRLCVLSGLPRATLVAVHASSAYWQASGFTVDALADVPEGRGLESYGAEACYMSMRVPDEAARR